MRGRADQTATQSFLALQFLVAGCTLLLQALIRKHFYFPEDPESSVRNLLCLALWGRVELEGERKGEGREIEIERSCKIAIP